MAEVEIAGAKIKGGKMLLLLPILGTLGGGLWGGFEFYKDYMNMRERIESYAGMEKAFKNGRSTFTRSGDSSVMRVLISHC